MRKFCSGLAHTILRGTVAVSAAIAVTSCIDNAYDLDNISKEVTVGGDVVILPLGELEEKSLGELIGDANTELVDEDGVYKIKYTGEGDTFTIDGITIDNITGLSPNIDPISFSAPAASRSAKWCAPGSGSTSSPSSSAFSAATSLATD